MRRMNLSRFKIFHLMFLVQCLFNLTNGLKCYNCKSIDIDKVKKIEESDCKTETCTETNTNRTLLFGHDPTYNETTKKQLGDNQGGSGKPGEIICYSLNEKKTAQKGCTIYLNDILTNTGSCQAGKEGSEICFCKDDGCNKAFHIGSLKNYLILPLALTFILYLNIYLSPK